MREIIARSICVLTGCVVVALSFLFAAAHNPPASAKPASPSIVVPAPVVRPPEKPETSDVERGRAVYAEQNCSTCHAIAGEGNPRVVLDGVGDRRDAAALREWITGTGAAAGELSVATARRKARYQQLPEADLSALVAFLSTLVTPK